MLCCCWLEGVRQVVRFALFEDLECFLCTVTEGFHFAQVMLSRRVLTHATLHDLQAWRLASGTSRFSTFAFEVEFVPFVSLRGEAPLGLLSVNRDDVLHDVVLVVGDGLLDVINRFERRPPMAPHPVVSSRIVLQVRS